MLCAEQPARSTVSPWSTIYTTQTRTHGSTLSILLLAVVAIMAVCTNYSAWSSTCVVATAEEKLHGSQHYWSKPVDLPSYVWAGVRVCFLCAQACFFLISARVCIWLMCMFQAHVAQVRAGKDAVYEIGIIYLGCGGGWWRLPGASTAGNIQTRERSLWFVVEWSRCEAIYKWGIPIRSCPAQLTLGREQNQSFYLKKEFFKCFGFLCRVNGESCALFCFKK